MAESANEVVRSRVVITYAGLVGFPVAALFAVIHFGERLSAPPRLHEIAQAGVRQTSPGGIPSLAILMAQIGVIILLSRVVGSLLERIRQPRVIGEMIAGILLGPSFLGWVSPGLSAFFFPPASFAILNALSQLGLVLFMFMVGLELNIRELHRQGHIAVLISHASITAPMALGAALALFLYPRISDSTVGFTGFALFMGVAMSITAFPVLARILSERKALRTRMGTMALACAAVDDVTGWCVLAYVVTFVRAAHSSLPVWVTLVGLLVFLGTMFTAGRVALRRIERAYLTHGELTDDWKALLLVVLLGSALVTEALGIHLLFGAFIAGAIMPRDPGLVSYVTDKFHSLTVLLLLPLFFAFTGLRTSIGLLRDPAMWGICLLIIAVAVTGKLGGTSIAARLGGLSWRESLALGSLMNTRGLMELVILNIGLEIKVISPQLFSMMVLMAIATTMMTPPLLEWLYPARRDLPAIGRAPVKIGGV